MFKMHGGGSVIKEEDIFPTAATDVDSNLVLTLYDHFNGSFDAPVSCLYGWIDVLGANISCLLKNYTGRSGHGLLINYNYWSLILLVFPLLTVFGNVLVVLGVYKERSLRTVTNYFIVSLAIADIMVAILVMPLAVYVQVCTGRITFHTVCLSICPLINGHN